MSTLMRLSPGALIPIVGLGMYRAAPGEAYEAVKSALKVGYRHIDTAQLYNNEEDVGRAVCDSGLPRAEVFVTTKVWRSEWGYDKTLSSIKASLKRLGLSYVDLVLLHSPGDARLRPETWRALEDAQEQGLTKAIGVSNFNTGHIDKLLETARIPPAVNQIELTPFLQWRELVAYCKARSIVVQAYSPLVKGKRLQDPRLMALADRSGVTTAQLLIRWSIQKGYVPLPKSVHPERQAKNLDVFSFVLAEDTMQALDALEEGLITGWTPILDDAI